MGCRGVQCTLSPMPSLESFLYSSSLFIQRSGSTTLIARWYGKCFRWEALTPCYERLCLRFGCA